ncbi:Dipeptidyl-peptidase 7 [anaerobic digester metagenome]
MFRVYANAEGKPADYSKDNVPLKPKHHLTISLNGYERGDFAMIMGYPGSTDRYLTSWGVELAIETSNPTIVDIRAKKLEIMRKDMDASRDINIKYASKYASTSNYWKYFIGQTRGLKRLKVVDKKRKTEAEFREWVNADLARKAKYGSALSDIETAYTTISDYALQRWYLIESIIRGGEIMTLANSFTALDQALTADNPSESRIKRVQEMLKKSVEKHFKNYNQPTDIKLLEAMLQMYYENVPVSQQPADFRALVNKENKDFQKLAQNIFKKSMFADEASVMAFLENPSSKKLEKDPAYTLVKSFMDQYRTNMKQMEAANELLARGNRLFVAGLREMQPNRKFYPDANSTMRLTYGQILDYYPADAVHYNHYTTLAGVMEKEDPSNREFVVPEKLKQLFKDKDYGRYGENGELMVGFLSNTDITGGNSGSPVMNGKGELIGIAFDGNWEAMSGDIAFEPELQRTISVDIRYVMFVVDKYAGAQNIIDELTFAPKDLSKPKRNMTQEEKNKSEAGIMDEKQ